MLREEITHLKNFPHGKKQSINFFGFQKTKYSANSAQGRRQPTRLNNEINFIRKKCCFAEISDMAIALTLFAYHLTTISGLGVENILVSDLTVYRRIATSVTV